MTVTLYLKKNCSTCTDARKHLAGQGVSFTERELFKDPLTEAEIRELLGDRPATDLLSTKSPRFKELGLVGKAISHEECIRLMASEPYLIRRPTFTVGSELVIGFDKARLDVVLGLAQV